MCDPMTLSSSSFSLKSLSICSSLSSTNELSCLSYFSGPNDFRAIVAVKSCQFKCNLFYFDIRSDRSGLSLESLVRTRFAVFPKAIETLILLHIPSTEATFPVPVLIGFCSDGNMYISGPDDLSKVNAPDEVSISRCRKEIVGALPGDDACDDIKNGQCLKYFIGINLVSCLGLLSSVEIKDMGETIILVAGSRSLSAPSIVVLSRHNTFRLLRIGGFESSRYGVSAVTIFHEKVLSNHARRKLQRLWKIKASQNPEPNWNADHVFIAMISLNDGSIFLSYVTTEIGSKNIAISKATKLYEGFLCPNQKVISFCFVPDIQSKDDSMLLVCVGSRGGMAILSGFASDDEFQFVTPQPQILTKYQENAKSRSFLDIIQAEFYPLSLEGRDVSSNESPYASIVVTTKNDSPYVIKLMYHIDNTFSGQILPSPLRRDMVSISACYVPPSDGKTRSAVGRLLTSITFRRSMQLFIARESTFQRAACTTAGSNNLDSLLESLFEAGASRMTGGDESLNTAISVTRKTSDITSSIYHEFSLRKKWQHLQQTVLRHEISADSHDELNNKQCVSSIVQSRCNHFSEPVSMPMIYPSLSVTSLKILGSQVNELKEINARIPLVYGGAAYSYSYVDCRKRCHDLSAFALQKDIRSIHSSTTISWRGTALQKKRKLATGTHNNVIRLELSCHNPDSICATGQQLNNCCNSVPVILKSLGVLHHSRLDIVKIGTETQRHVRRGAEPANNFEPTHLPKGGSIDLKKITKYLNRLKESLQDDDNDIAGYLDIRRKVRSISSKNCR